MKEKKRIVLMVPSSRGCERALLRGISKYSKYHGPWIFYMDLPDYVSKGSFKKKMDWLKDIRAEGIVARVPYLYTFEELIATKLPVVLMNIYEHSNDFPGIIPDCEGLALLAVEYLQKKGFKNFAYCGFENMFWCHERGRYFHDILKQKGFSVHSFYEKAGQLQRSWKKEENTLVEWLVGLPKPVGIFTSNDDMGRHIIQACKIADILVPEEAAILGADNDSLVCELTDPSLSSVAYNFEKCGYEAACLLHRLMNKETIHHLNVVMEPTHVITRQSTDIMAIHDHDMIKALNFMKQNFKKNITIEDVARKSYVSARALQRKFKQFFNRSPHDELVRIRMEYAAVILIESNIQIGRIANEIGFEEIKHFSRLFKKTWGISPSEYRKKYGKM